MTHMRLIGKGWQYKVFDLGNGRVRKLERPVHYRYWLILYRCLLRANRARLPEVYEEMKLFRQRSAEAMAYIKSVYHILDKRILGNPVFLENNNYEQDKVRIVEDCFRDLSSRECEKIIDGYVDLLLQTWTYGFSDAVFNFTQNDGLDTDGAMVQVDFGEIALSKEMVRSHIMSQAWLRSWSFTRMQDRKIKDYFREAMADKVTISNLDSLWASTVARKSLPDATEAPAQSRSWGR